MILQVSICGDEDIKFLRFCGGDQVAVLQFRPAALVRSLDLMSNQRPSKRRGRALIEENFHSGSFESATGGVFEYSPGLLGSDARKPLDKLVQRRVVFKVLKESGDRHARTSKDPGSANAAGVPFDGRTAGPIDHGQMVAPSAFCAA